MPVVKVYLRRDYTLFVVKINLYDNLYVKKSIDPEVTNRMVNRLCRSKRIVLVSMLPHSHQQLNFNDQLPVVLRVDLHILVAVRIYHNPGSAESVVEGVVGMAMNPEIRAMVDDLTG